MSTDAAVLTKKDFQSDQEVRWCPGCGDYAILSSLQTVLAELGIPKENFVVVSGIGCSSRFPYYVDTYGFHSIHGRAPAIASGIKIARPELEVWVATGDGDALSIGGNHLIHAMRRNIGLKIVMFNNRIYGLTKGQYSPTSEVGKKTKSSPVGSVDAPFNPLGLALGSGATFVARGVDIFQKHLREVLHKTAQHQGAAFVEVYQNCNIFNDKAFAFMTAKDARKEQVVYLEHGQPLVFGAESDKGIRFRNEKFEVVRFGDGVAPEDCLVWNETSADPSMAFHLAHMGPPDFPTPVGVFRNVQAMTYEAGVAAQIESEIERKGEGSLRDLIHAGELWTVNESGEVTRDD